MLTGRRFERRGSRTLRHGEPLGAREELLDAAHDLAAGVIANSEYGVYMTKIGLRRARPRARLRRARRQHLRRLSLSQFIRVGLSSCDVGTSYLLPRIVGPTARGGADAHRSPLRRRGGRAHRPGEPLGGLRDGAPRRGARIWTARADRGKQRVRRVDDEAAACARTSTRRACGTRSSSRTARRCSGTFTGNMAEAGEAFREKRDPVWKPM